MNKHQVKGATNQVTGEIKQQAGKLTGDRTLQAKGQAREMKGKLQQGVGDAKESMDRSLDRDLDRDTTTTRRDSDR